MNEQRRSGRENTSNWAYQIVNAAICHSCLSPSPAVAILIYSLYCSMAVPCPSPAPHSAPSLFSLAHLNLLCTAADRLCVPIKLTSNGNSNLLANAKHQHSIKKPGHSINFELKQQSAQIAKWKFNNLTEQSIRSRARALIYGLAIWEMFFCFVWTQ